MPGILQLDAEADSEQQREQGVELAVYEEELEPPHYPVKGSMSGRIGESPQGKLRKIGQNDPEKGKSAQSIQYDVSYLLRH